MSYPHRRSISADDRSFQAMSQEGAAEIPEPATAETADHLDRPPNLAVEIQALQILDNSDDCIAVLDLEGRILFLNRRGQALLGIQDSAPLLNTSWVNFWQESEQTSARAAIARAAAGEVCSLQGYCPTLKGEPKWWDNKISPLLGVDGSVEQLVCISRDITEQVRVEDERKRDEAERQQTETTLRQNQEMFAALVADAPFGVYMIDAEFRFQQANQTAIAAFNLGSLIGRDLAEALRIIWQEPFATEAIDRFRHTLATGEPYYSPPIVEPRADIAEIQSYDWQLHRITLSDGRYGVVCYFYDLSEIKRAEAIIRRNADRDAFLITLNDALRPLTDAIKIQATASRVLGEYLAVSRVTYFEVRGEDYVVEQDYVNGVASLQGGYSIESFGAKLLATYRRGRTATSTNVAIDPQLSPDQRSAYADIQIAAYIGIPLVKQGEFVAGLAVHSSTPRHWTRDEIALAEEVAERTWAAVERARAETALRESEAKYRSLFKSIDQGFCLFEVLFDANGKPIDYRFVDVNQAFEQQCGLVDAVGKTILELAPNFEPQWIERYAQVAKSGEAIRFEADVPSLNSIFDIYAFPSGAPGQNLVAALFANITERKQTEIAIAADLKDTQLLRDLSARLATEESVPALYQEITAAAIALTHADAGTVQILDETTQDLVLLATQGFDQKMVEYFYRVNTSSHTPCGIALKSGIRSFVDFDVPASEDPDGSMRLHVEAGLLSAQSTPLISRSGKPIGMVSTHWRTHHRPSDRELRFLDLLARQAADLIDRRQTEAALRESEELKQSILDSSKDCIKVLTLDGKIIYMNTGGLHLLEIDDPMLVLNAQWLDLWQGEDRENAKTAIAAAKAGNTGQFQGYRPTHKGTPKWWDIVITPVRNSAGQVTQLLIVSRDITKQKQAEMERERLLAQEQAAREQAETANRIKDEFLAVLSHELRSPLNPILGWTRLLQNSKLDAVRQREALATIERNAKLQTQLIEDLLDISRIMRGKLSLTVAPVGLPFVISAAVETVRLAAEAKTIQIILDLAPDIALVSGDAARLQQVVWNLLSNAVKFTPSDGQVTIELRQLDRSAQIRVIDTGKGITPQFLPYVFEYFRQEDGSTTRKFGGLGLGLAIVRQIVQMHGGSVWAESQGEGQGATFIVQLPTMPQKAVVSEPSQPQSDTELSLAGIQILLVDDEPDTREFQAFLLEQSGAQVTAIASGLAALQALEQSIPDVIVSDIGMAEMDGYMLLQQIRSRPSKQGGKIPAIALTAYAAEIDQQRAIQVGFQRHLTKPVEPDVLVKAIATLLERT